MACQKISGDIGLAVQLTKIHDFCKLGIILMLNKRKHYRTSVRKFFYLHRSIVWFLSRSYLHSLLSEVRIWNAGHSKQNSGKNDRRTQ